MIELFDETLRELFRREVLDGSGVEIAFDAPTKDWAARRNAPTVDVYLYDIRDDLERRDAAWGEVRDEAGRVLERRPPPRRFRLSYLVTAWTQRPEDEHRLLSACLTSLLRHEALAPAELSGPLAEQPHAVELTVALPPGADRSIADVWTALGGELKPSIDLVASVPFVVDRRVEAGPPVREAPRIRVEGPDGAREGEEAGGGRAARGSGPAGRSGARHGTEPLPEEAVTAGTGDAPGRLLRVRGLPRR